MNTMKMMKVASAWRQFCDTHPKFTKFMMEVPRQTFRENTVLEITITTEDGKTYSSNMKVTADDLTLYEEMRELMRQSDG